ncbi:MAG TPA: arginine deiminase-related protein [Flavitalea sp.]|nr:arginine deiminase-related protein [Flavitalea sp.]
MQTTSHLLMMSPARFGYNAETAVNNAFQLAAPQAGVQEEALKEFNHFAALLQAEGMDVLVIPDTPEPHTPDSIFPNNWVSFHADGTVCLYPMFAPNRRIERNPAILNILSQRFFISRVVDLSIRENENRFLEGTGSMVLDRVSRIAYAGISPRTDKQALLEFCDTMEYRPVIFDTVARGGPVYHTNVMMSIAETYAVVCLEAVSQKRQRQELEQSLASSGKALIEISIDQMNHFAGNMLQVNDEANRKALIMSTGAYQSLTRAQADALESFNRIIHAPLPVIEANGGGSARCMIAEIHLPLLK